jgi:hypothetical protein
MRKLEFSRRNEGQNVPPCREYWWWRENRLKGALNGNRQLDHFFYWKVKGRKSPDGTKWTSAQRRAIETAVWLYELDARISRKYLFGKPAHLLTPEHLTSAIAAAQPMHVSSQKVKTGQRRKPFAWAWIEYFDKRNDKKEPKLTRAELNGIIAAMKYCLEYFLHG